MNLREHIPLAIDSDHELKAALRGDALLSIQPTVIPTTRGDRRLPRTLESVAQVHACPMFAAPRPIATEGDAEICLQCHRTRTKLSDNNPPTLPLALARMLQSRGELHDHTILISHRRGSSSGVPRGL